MNMITGARAKAVLGLGRLKNRWRDPLREVQARQIEVAFKASPHNLGLGVLAVIIIAAGSLTISDWVSESGNRLLQTYLMPLLWGLSIAGLLLRGIGLSKAFQAQLRSA